MLNENEAREMVKELRKLGRRAKKSRTKQDKQLYKEYELHCLKSLDYFVITKTSKYRGFANYEDLVQEARESLLKALNTFNVKKGSFFFWASLFVNTRLSRAANNHTVIRYPMHYAKIHKPHKENYFPIIQDPKFSPERACEVSEINNVIRDAIKNLNQTEKNVIQMLYGFDTNKPLSITKICQKLKISRPACIKIINEAVEILKENIDL